MCGRYCFSSKAFDLPLFLENLTEYSHRPRYSIAPTQTAPIIIKDGLKNIINLAKWGLVPFWAKDDSFGKKLINARSETAHEKPAFRSSFQNKRCLIPANGFYEWETGKSGKSPHLFRLVSNKTFAFAGLWDTWQPKDGPMINSFTIF